jgi:hypothetical protein
VLKKYNYKSVVGFLFVGILTVLVNLITFQFFLILGFSVYVAAFIGNLTSILANFAGLNSVFETHSRLKAAFRYLISWVAYYFLTIWLITLFINISLEPLSARFVTLLILTPINYIAQKYLVFRP